MIYPDEPDPFLDRIAGALLDAPVAIAEGVGGIATFRRIPGTLVFDDRETGGQWEYRTEIYIADADDGENYETGGLPSLLGMDILRHWIPQGISPSRPAVLFAAKSA